MSTSSARCPRSRSRARSRSARARPRRRSSRRRRLKATSRAAGRPAPGTIQGGALRRRAPPALSSYVSMESGAGTSREGSADSRRDRNWPALCAVDEDMHEITRRSRLLVPRAEQADLVAHARIAELANAQARLDHFRIGELALEPAHRLDRESDD